MRVASPSRGRPAHLPLCAMLLTLATTLAGCHTSTLSPPGTPVVTFGGEGTSPDFASYIVIIDSLTLTRNDGTLVSVVSVAQEVDLAKISDLAELIGAPAAPDGTYTSATVALDFSAASIWVNQNGKPVLATLTNVDGVAAPTFDFNINFDTNHPLIINQGVSQRLHMTFDLAASNSIVAGSPPTVVVQPFIVLSPAPVDSTLVRARGLFVIVPTGTSTYIQNSRPFFDQQSALGAVNVIANEQTYFSVDGVSYTGAAGLAAMAGLATNTPTEAIGTLDNLSGITPTMDAKQIYAGASLESPITATVTGVVGARSGDSITVLGATCYQPTTASALGSFAYFASLPLTVDSTTFVSRDGVIAPGLNANSISVGQEITAFGPPDLSSTFSCVGLNAGAGGLVRLNSTRLWGELESATPTNAVVDALTLGNFDRAGFDFAGTGAGGQNANPTAYSVNTGSLDQSAVAPNTLLRVDGIVAPFGGAPPDFLASAIVPGTATSQQLVVEWGAGGSLTPFTHAGSDYLQVNLADPNIDQIDYIRTGPGVLELKKLPASPHITTTGAPQNDLELAIGSTTLSTGISVYNTAGDFATALGSTFPASGGTNKIYRLVAYGQYNAVTNTFVAGHIFVALHE